MGIRTLWILSLIYNNSDDWYLAMNKMLLLLCSFVALLSAIGFATEETREDESDRGLFSWVGGCDTSFCASSKWLLKKNGLYEKVLVKKEHKGNERIRWKQWKYTGCNGWRWWKRWCDEEYALYTYYVQGNPKVEILVHMATREYPQAKQSGVVECGENYTWET